MNLGIATIAALLLLLPGIGFIVGVNIADKNVREVVFRNTPAELGYVIFVSLVVHLVIAVMAALAASGLSAISSLNPPEFISALIGRIDSFNAAFIYIENLDASKLASGKARDILIFSLTYFLIATAVGFLPGWVLGRWIREQRWYWTSFFVKHRWMIALIKTGNAGSITARAVLKDKHGIDAQGKERPIIVEGVLSDSYFASDGKLLYLVFKAFSISNADGSKSSSLAGLGTLEESISTEPPADQLIIEGDRLAAVRFSRRLLPLSRIEALQLDA